MTTSFAPSTTSSTTSTTIASMRPERVPKIWTDCRKLNLACRSAIVLFRRMCVNIVRWRIHIRESTLARMVAVRARSYTSATSPKTVSAPMVSTSLPPTTTASEPVSTQYARSPDSPSFTTSTPAFTSTGAIAATSCSRSAASCPSKGAFLCSVLRMRCVSSSAFGCTCTTTPSPASSSSSITKPFGPSTRFRWRLLAEPILPPLPCMEPAGILAWTGRGWGSGAGGVEGEGERGRAR